MTQEALSRILSDAMTQIRAGNFREAEILLHPVVTQAKPDDRALKLLGYARHGQGARDEGLKLIAQSCDVARIQIDTYLARHSEQSSLSLARHPEQSSLSEPLAYALQILWERERGLGWLMHQTGLGRRAEFWFARSWASQQQYKEFMGPISDTEPIALRSDAALYFGDISLHLGLYCKMMKLGWIASRRPIIFTGAGVANRYFLDLWRDWVDIDERHPSKIVLGDHFDMFLPLVHEGRGLLSSSAFSFVQQEWEARGFGSLLQLPPEICARGKEFLEQEIGMERTGWFVTLHMRDPGYGMRKGRREERAAHRNQSLEITMAAVDLITACGGWVIRLGDETAPPIPSMPYVFDYAHCSDREEWLDVYLCAAARFYWGTSSGPITVASAFGTPIIGSNWVPASLPLPESDCLFLLKRIWFKGVGRWANLAEMLNEPFYNAQYPWIYDEADVVLVENTAEEIRGMIREKLSALTLSRAERIRQYQTPRQEAARAIYQSAGLVLNAKLAEASLVSVDGIRVGEM